MTMKKLAVALMLAASSAHAAAKPSFKKVMIVILENAGAKEALAQPYLASLAKKGALLKNYHAVGHPSQPNYVALIAGDTLGTPEDDQVDFSSSTRHLGDLLEARGKTWGVYVEGYPGQCETKMRIGKYARKHEPFISFRNVSGDPARCARLKTATELDKDLAEGRLPDFSLYVPDLDNDGHDTDAGFASRWLEKSFGPRFSDKAFMKDVLVVVTFDEDEGTKENLIYTALVGAGVKPGTSSSKRYTHYDLLRTIEDAFGVGNLGRNDAKAVDIRGVWRRK